MHRRLAALPLAAVLAVACRDATTPPASPAGPMAAVFSQRPDKIPGEYIVRLRDNATNVDGLAGQMVGDYRGQLQFTYKSAIKGFAAKLSPAAAAALARRADVLSVEQNGYVYADATQLNPPSWGLDRIDQRALPLDNSYTSDLNGTGVTVYIIVTGINFGHSDFGGRAVTGEDEVTPGGTAADCNGHGTHVSGTVGGASFGVAKNVRLVAVRVLDCNGSGTFAQVIAGIDYVTAQKTANPSVPSAANMSLGGSLNTSLNAAVQRSTAAGVTYAVAAGNSSADACKFSPAATPEAITVGATDITDTRASFSNFCTCVDLFAPVVDITSAWIPGNATNTISGTSMASPHAAGVAALYLQANPGASAATVSTALTTNATAGVVANPGSGSPNLLLYMGFLNGGPPPPPPPPPPPGPPAPVLSSPADGANNVAVPVTLSWQASSGATSYHAQVSTSSTFTPLVYDQTGITTTSTTVSGLARRTTYFWRVFAADATGEGPASAVRSFRTAKR